MASHWLCVCVRMHAFVSGAGRVCAVAFGIVKALSSNSVLHS